MRCPELPGPTPGLHEPGPSHLFMENTESPEELDVESRPIRGARLIGFGSLAFWPLFLFAMKFLMDPPLQTTAAQIERRILVDCIWLYPVAVLLAWFLARHNRRQGRTDVVCLLSWLLPVLLACYFPVYFFL